MKRGAGSYSAPHSQREKRARSPSGARAPSTSNDDATTPASHMGGDSGEAGSNSGDGQQGLDAGEAPSKGSRGTKRQSASQATNKYANKIGKRAW